MIKLAAPKFSDKTLAEMLSVLASGQLVQGKYTEKFESSLKAYLQVKNAIVVSSGTAALHLSLMALDIDEGDEVICPAFTFPATTNVVEVVGGNAVLVDINLSDFCINSDKIEEKITKNTKAIIPVHEFGQPADMTKIFEIAKKHCLKIIEDAACALGAEYKGVKVGTIGDIGCFSLHPRKAITTGEGGVVVTNDDALACKLRALRNHGIEYDTSGIKFSYAGLNYRITDIQSALGLGQFSRLEKYNKARLRDIKIYSQKLAANENITLPIFLSDRESSWQTYHILISQKFNRDEVINKLKESGIETNYGAYAINLLDYYKSKYKLDSKSFPNSVYAYKHGLALPVGSHVSVKDARYIADTLSSILC
jgi:dTDP-4-amino-4,6-dideoxygalactose transaminase